MSQKLPLTLWFTLVIAIVALFLATQVMAQTRPLECTSTDGKLKLSPSPAASAFPQPDDGTICGAPGNFWLFRATANNPKFLAKINKIYFYIPSSPPNIIEVYYASEPGGGGISGWGSGVYNGVVVTAQQYSGANDPYKEVGFCTSPDIASYGLISAVFDTGTGGELGCEAIDAAGTIIGGIIGPGFDVGEVVLGPDAEDVSLPLGNCVRVKRHPWTGRIQNFTRCDGPSTPIPRRDSWGTEDIDIVDFGDPANRGVRGGIIATSGGSTVYWGWTPPNNYYCLGVYDEGPPATWRTTPCP
jgi:hypothetical protein